MRHRTIISVALGAGLLAAACAPVSPFRSRDQLVRDPTHCAAQRFEVYFADSQARLTDAAREAIDLNAARLQGCEVRRVRVLGLADARTGTPATNLTLSEQRARTVAEALLAAGLPRPVFEVGAAGADGAVATGGALEPMRRRTEILIEAARR